MSSPLEAFVRRHSPALHHRLHKAKRRLHRGTTDAAAAVMRLAGRYEILVVFGMRRSGNHLAITWMLEQVDGIAAFYNNLRPASDPLAHFHGRMTEHRWHPGLNHRLVLSYEDFGTDEMLSPPLRTFLEARMDRGVPVRFALVLRDPYNLFASRLRKWPELFQDPAEVHRQIALYKSHAAQAADPRPFFRDCPVVPVLYSDLIDPDPAARNRMAGALGIRRGERGLHHVPIYGEGSSFDGKNVPGATLNRQTMRRWERMQDDPAFRPVLDDPELGRLARRFPGAVPAAAVPQ